MNNCLTDKEMMTDLLTHQKTMTNLYNNYSNECTNKALQSDMLTILREEHNMQADIFTELKKRGWYMPTDAQQTEIKQARAKYQGLQASL